MKIMFGCWMNVEAEKAGTVKGYWLDLNLPATGSHEEEVENFISEILSKGTNVKIEKKENDEQVSEKLGTISEG